MSSINRRQWIQSVGAIAGTMAGALGVAQLPGLGRLAASEPSSDSLPMQLYKSLSDQQKRQVCLPINHPRRQYVSKLVVHPSSASNTHNV